MLSSAIMTLVVRREILQEVTATQTNKTTVFLFLLALVSVVVVHRALGSFSLQYVELNDFSPDCVSKAGEVERGDFFPIGS